MLRRMSRSIMAVVLSLCVMFTMMPLVGGSDAHADAPGTYDISQGNITIGDTGVTSGSSQGTDTYTGDITIEQSGTGSTTNRIRVNRKASVTIILNGVDIDLYNTTPSHHNFGLLDQEDIKRHEGCALYVAQTDDTGVSDLSSRTVTVKLAGTNTLKSGPWDAGIEKNGDLKASGSLIIEDDYNTTGTGSLTATSGVPGNSAGAGIGGGFYILTGPIYSSFEGSNITINSGEITAESNSTGAGIGGGQGGEGNDITINGGTVTASSYYTDGNLSTGSGAGIGGGSRKAGNNIKISGGTVMTKSLGGACIGGGTNSAGKNVTISGGTVTAASYGDGAGIGNGSDGTGSSFRTTATGKAFVTSSSSMGASISDTSGKTSTTDPWSGIIIENKVGKVYTGQKDGGTYSLTTNETLPSGYTLEVPSGKTFDVTSINSAPALTNSGLIINNGTMTGTAVSGLVLTKPSFTNSTADLNGTTASYPVASLTYAQPAANSSYKAYTAETGGTALNDPSISPKPIDTSAMALTFTTLPQNGDSFYISAAYSGNGYNAETDRTKVQVNVTPPAPAPTPSPTTHDIKIEQPSGGSISISDQNASAGEKETVTADPDPGYHLDYILVNGEKETNTTFTMPDSNVTVSAVFAVNTYKITAKASPNKHGKVSGAKTVSYGSSVKLKAKAKSGYMFKKWTEKGKTVGKKKTLTVRNITAAHNYKAVFKKVPVKFTLSKYKSNMIRVHWAKVKGAKGYQISNNATGKMTTKWTGSNSLNTYTSIMKRKGVTYKYKMRYYKVKKGKRVWSSWTPIKTIKR